MCFFKKSKSGSKFPITGMIVAYVDDLIVAGDSRTVEDFYKEFGNHALVLNPRK